MQNWIPHASRINFFRFWAKKEACMQGAGFEGLGMFLENLEMRETCQKLPPSFLRR